MRLFGGSVSSRRCTSFLYNFDVPERSAAATVSRVLSLPAYLRARSLSVYLTMPTGELQTEEVVRNALSQGKTVYIPFTKLPDEPDTMKMLRLDSIQDLDNLKPNAWKIPEHESAAGRHEGVFVIALHKHVLSSQSTRPALDPDSEGLDLILLPGLAFDRQRTRLGHGKGYYDRYLALTELWCRTRDKPMPATGVLQQFREV